MVAPTPKQDSQAVEKPLRFDDRVVVVTGAGNGLGRAYALEFARRGASVVVNDLGSFLTGEACNTSDADQVVAEIRSFGGEAVASYDSVTDGEAVIQTALDNYDRVDVLVNNAGNLRDVSFTNMSDTDWQRVLDVHLLGTYKTSHAAWPIMRQQGFGRILNTASPIGMYGNFGQANYSCAKMGVVGLTQTLALEGAKYNIQVNAIAPLAKTRMSDPVLPESLKEQLSPELITPLVVKLCSQENTETGSLFEAGAGWFAKLRWQRNSGVLLDQDGVNAERLAEQLAERWDQVCNFESADYPSHVEDTFTAIAQKLGISF